MAVVVIESNIFLMSVEIEHALWTSSVSKNSITSSFRVPLAYVFFLTWFLGFVGVKLPSHHSQPPLPRNLNGTLGVYVLGAKWCGTWESHLSQFFLICRTLKFNLVLLQIDILKESTFHIFSLVLLCSSGRCPRISFSPTSRGSDLGSQLNCWTSRQLNHVFSAIHFSENFL